VAPIEPEGFVEEGIAVGAGDGGQAAGEGKGDFLVDVIAVEGGG
jgi:hypothetical protein